MAASTASSAGAGIVPEFQYEALPNPETHIRLLEIKPSKTKLGRRKYRCRYGSVADYEDDTVECNLTVWRVDNTPEYVAISYTWGEDDRSTDRDVLVNGRCLRVRKSCDESLRQARRYDGPKYCWIDGICINQTNDDGNHEKNHQVRIMGDIYRNAIHVLACVGPCDETSHCLFSMVKWSAWPRGFFAHMHAHEWVQERPWVAIVLGLADFTLFLVHDQFRKRDYFYRVWILQELFLARRVTISCGSHFVTATDLDMRMRLAKERVYEKFSVSHNDHWIVGLAKKLTPRDNDVWDFFNRIWIRSADDWNWTLATSSPEELMTLEKALFRVADLRCSEPRDRIYGILSMVRWDGLDYITPDYNKPKLELAVEVLLALRVEYAYRLWDLGKSVISALAMGLGDVDVAGAISARRSGITAPVPVLLTDRHPTNNIRRLSSVFKFQGRRICEEDDWVLAPHLQSTKRGTQQDKEPNGSRYQTIRSKETGKVIGFVPEATKPDDWIITHSSLGFSGATLGGVSFALAIIARHHPPGQQYHLESPAFIFRKAIEKLPLTNIDVLFDPQDLLILFIQAHGQFTRFTTTAHRLKRVTEMLQVRFCHFEGSSYALHNGDDPDRCNNENTSAYEDFYRSEGLDPNEDLDIDDDGDVDEDSGSDRPRGWTAIHRLS